MKKETESAKADCGESLYASRAWWQESASLYGHGLSQVVMRLWYSSLAGAICEKQIRVVVSVTYLQQACSCFPRGLSRESSRHGTSAQGALPHRDRVFSLQGQIA